MRETGVNTLVARCSRRNSTIEVWETDVNKKVCKSYRLRYAVVDEVEAYERVALLLSDVAGIRAADVLAVNYETNVIEIEYVEGLTLAKKAGSEGIAVLREFSEPFLQMLALAYAKGTKFDCDPSNFIVDQLNGVLVLVDPPCLELPLSHLSAVVFFWGLIKAAIPQGYRIKQRIAFAKMWNELYARYCHRTCTKRSVLDRQMSAYIAQVIKWNLHESGRENLAKRIARRGIIVPCWWLIRMGFKASARVRESHF